MHREPDSLHNLGDMPKNNHSRAWQENGFSLIEILLVMTIIGVIVAVVVPRAHRAQVSAKYNIVRQSATELGTWGMEWAERNLNSQLSTDSSLTHDYLDTLVGYTGNDSINWINTTASVANRVNPVQFSVANIMPQEKMPKNPFNGASYFSTLNGGAPWTAGDLYLGSLPIAPGSDEVEYYFVYHGTDSTAENTWHAGMGNAVPPTSYSNLRNGVFVARQRVP